MEISQIDIGRIGLQREFPDLADYLSIGNDLFKAFESTGFAYIKEHGIPTPTIQQGMRSSKKFFNLPKEEKNKYKKDDVIQHGYVEPDREIFTDTTQDTIREIRESWDLTRIEGENAAFPDELVQEFKYDIVALAQKSRELSFRLMRSLALALGLDQEYFVDESSQMFTRNSHTKLRSLHYPAIQKDIEPGWIRCGEHTDYGLITLLYQDSMGGLEVNGVGGEWIDAKPIEGSVLINVGDMLEIFTSGRLPATMHRVRVPQEEVQRKTSRQSVVFFVHLNNDSIVRPLTAFPNVNQLPKYQEVTALQHVIKRFESAKGKN